MRLITFGGLGIEPDSSDAFGPAAARRRPLALLAVLAAAGARPVSRERLCTLFWPESDGERARNSLNQMLFALRRDLGRTDVLLGSAELLLNPEHIRSDVGEFECAVRDKRLEEAALLYVGAFLDGVYLKDSPKSFEEFVETERARLDDRASDVLRSLAGQATARGDLAGAVAEWKRFVALRPADSRAASHLIRALVSAGSRTAALEYARIHEAYLRTQFDCPMDPEVAVLVAQITEGAAMMTPVVVTPVVVTPVAVAPVRDAPFSATTLASDSESRNSDESPAPSKAALAVETYHKPFAHSARLAVLAAIALLLLVVVSAVHARARGSGSVPVDSTLLAVMPFVVHGDTTGNYLREGLVDLLSTDLDEAGGLHTVDSHVVLAPSASSASVHDLERAYRAARELRAGLFVFGDVTASGGLIRLTANLYEASGRDRPIVRAESEGSADSLFQLTSLLTRRLLAGRAAGASGTTGLTATATSSVDALKAYLEGQRAMRTFHSRDAMEDFQRAEALDSAFALAPYALSSAADWSSEADVAQRAAERALRHSASLPQRAQWLLQGAAAWRRGNGDQAEAALRKILTHHPEDLEANAMLAEVLFHLNAARGRSLLEARPILQKVVRLHPTDFEALMHLARLAAFEGQRQQLHQLIPQIAAARFRGDDEARFLYAARFQSPAEQAALFDSLRPGTSISLAVTCWRVAVYSRRPDRAEPMCRQLIEPVHEAEWRAVGFRRLAELALAGGRFREASRNIAALATLVPEQAIELSAWISSIPLAPAVSSTPALADDLLRMRGMTPNRTTEVFAPFNGKHMLIREYLLTTAVVSKGVLQTAEAAVRRVEEHRPADTASRALAMNFARALRAELEARKGHVAEALALLGQNAGQRSAAGDRWPGEELYSRYLRGQLLTRLGKHDEALQWYASFTDPFVEDIILQAPSELASAQLEKQRGHILAAVKHYHRFVELWRDADAEVQTTVSAARSQAQLLEQQLTRGSAARQAVR